MLGNGDRGGHIGGRGLTVTLGLLVIVTLSGTRQIAESVVSLEKEIASRFAGPIRRQDRVGKVRVATREVEPVLEQPRALHERADRRGVGVGEQFAGRWSAR